jgi:hypothetical protein
VCSAKVVLLSIDSPTCAETVIATRRFQGWSYTCLPALSASRKVLRCPRDRRRADCPLATRPWRCRLTSRSIYFAMQPECCAPLLIRHRSKVRGLSTRARKSLWGGSPLRGHQRELPTPCT